MDKDLFAADGVVVRVGTVIATKVRQVIEYGICLGNNFGLGNLRERIESTVANGGNEVTIVVGFTTGTETGGVESTVTGVSVS